MIIRIERCLILEVVCQCRVNLRPRKPVMLGDVFDITPTISLHTGDEFRLEVRFAGNTRFAVDKDDEVGNYNFRIHHTLLNIYDLVTEVICRCSASFKCICEKFAERHNFPDACFTLQVRLAQHYARVHLALCYPPEGARAKSLCRM